MSYGVFLVTFGMCIKELLLSRSSTLVREAYNWPLIAVASLIFVLATMNITSSITLNHDAFIRYKGPGGANTIFNKISYTPNVMKTGCLQMMALVGDGMLIYRCFVVFFYDWKVVAFPILLWLGNAACGITIIYVSVTLRTDTLITANRLASFIISFLVITLVTNLLTTGLIVWRIWTVSRETNRAGGSGATGISLNDIIRIFIESAFLYTAFVLTTFIVTEATGSNAAYFLADVMIQMIGISFNLIIVRMKRGVALGDKHGPDSRQVSLPIRFQSRQLRFTATEDVELAAMGLGSLDTSQELDPGRVFRGKEDKTGAATHTEDKVQL